jgi:CHAT domain-containing protein/tetratricopeptide (TPR) repeat protein
MGLSVLRLLGLTLLVLCASGAGAAAPPPTARPDPPLTAEQRRRMRRPDGLRTQARALHQAGRSRQALDRVRAALALERKILPDFHPRVTATRRLIAGLHEELGQWDRARAAWRAVVAVQRKRYGPDDWRTKDARIGLADMDRRARLSARERRDLRLARARRKKAKGLLQQGRYRDAIKPAQEALALRTGVLGKDHADHGRYLCDLAVVRRHCGEYAETKRLFDRARACLKAVLGEWHPEHAHCLHELATLELDLGHEAEAHALFEQARAIRKVTLGVRRAEYAASLAGLAWIRRDRGEYPQALALAGRARAIRKLVLPERHVDQAASLHDLGTLYRDLGNYARARALYEQARELTRELLGERHPLYAASVSNLAGLYRALGDSAQAWPLSAQAHEVLESALGKQHPRYALSLHNLAALHADVGERPKARKLYEKAVGLLAAGLGKKHPAYALALNNLGLLYQDLGQHQQAERLLLEARALRKTTVGPKHPAYAASLHNLASLYRERGRHEQALPLYEEARKIRLATLGEHHPDHAATLCHLGLLYRARGKPGRAEPLLRAGLAILSKHLEDTFAALGERQRLILLPHLRQALDHYLSLGPAGKVPVARLYTHALTWKGAVAARSAEDRVARDEPGLAGLFEQLRAVRAGLARLAAHPPGKSGSEDWLKRFRTLEEQKEALEVRLARASAAFRPRRRASAEAVAGTLPVGTVLVDFLFYTHCTALEDGKPGWKKEPRLLAFVLKRGAKPVLLDLGPAATVEKAVAAWREPVRTGKGTSARAADALRRRLWEPVEKALGKAPVVVLAPDGVLWALPFAALPGRGKGSYLLEEYAFAHVTSGRHLLELAGRPSAPAGQGLLALGGVDYGKAPARSGATRGSGPLWSALPCAALEAERVDALYRARFPRQRAPRLLKGAGAGKARVLRELTPERPAERWRFVHFATHGYCIPPGVGSGRGGVGPRGGAAEQTFARNPLLLSGLVLARANVDAERGRLTAEEVASLDLRGTELVVLSACQTGLGQLVGGEGMLGLQRAFQAAGARSLVASLWNVSDAATSVLMEEFYQNLWQKKMTRLEALRRAQLTVLKFPRKVNRRYNELRAKVEVSLPRGGRIVEGRAPPSWWAGFVLSGDSGALGPPPADSTVSRRVRGELEE